jgi:hypothetical protein
VLYADDGGFAPDRARLVVWRTADGANPSTATALVHDDTRGADFDLDRAQPRRLTLGAMLVHPH